MNAFRNFFSKISCKLKENIKAILICLLILVNSKTVYMSFGASSRLKIIVLLFSLFVLFLLWLVTLDLNGVFSAFKEKNLKSAIRQLKDYIIRPDSLSIILICLLTILNFIINKVSGISNLNAVVGIIGVFVMGFLVAQLIEIKTFFRYISKLVFVFSVIAIFFYVFLLLDLGGFSTSIFSSSRNTYESYFKIFNVYFLADTNPTTRLLSIFWEPGLYANFLALALLYELFFADKTAWERVIVFSFCLFLTKSTAGYIIFIIILITYLLKFLKGKALISVTIIFLISIIFVVIFSTKIFDSLAKILPQVFNKLKDFDSGTTKTRLESPLYFLKVFATNPIIGRGFDGSMILYKDFVSGTLVDASTSTFAFIISSTGIFGIIFTLFTFIGFYKTGSEKLNPICRVLLAVIFFLISNTEVQCEILFIVAIYFMSIKNLSKYRLRENKYENIPDGSVLALVLKKDSNGRFASNVLGSVILKCLFLLAGFLTVPAFNTFFGNDTLYGTWLGIVSVLLTILSLDFGITDGLKNKLIEAKNSGDKEKSKKLISSSYYLLSIFALFFVAVFAILSYAINWNKFLSIPVDIASPNLVSYSVLIISITIGLQIVLRLIISILSANEKITFANSLTLFTNAGLLAFAILFKNASFDKMKAMPIVYLIMVNLPLVFATIYCFTKVLPDEKPSFKYVDKNEYKSILNIGFAFLSVQICNLVLWGFNKIIISNIFGPADVVYYEKYYKVFSTIVSLFMIIQPTLWVYIAKAKKEGNHSKVRKLINGAFVFCICQIVLALLAGVISQFLFDTWLGSNSFNVIFMDLLPFILYGTLLPLFSCVSLICYSLDILKGLSITALIVSIIKVPLVYLVHYLIPNINWSLVMWVDVSLIIPYTLVPLIELFARYKKFKKGNAL